MVKTENFIKEQSFIYIGFDIIVHRHYEKNDHTLIYDYESSILSLYEPNNNLLYVGIVEDLNKLYNILDKYDLL